VDESLLDGSVLRTNLANCGSVVFTHSMYMHRSVPAVRMESRRRRLERIATNAALLGALLLTACGSHRPVVASPPPADPVWSSQAGRLANAISESATDVVGGLRAELAAGPWRTYALRADLLWLVDRGTTADVRIATTSRTIKFSPAVQVSLPDHPKGVAIVSEVEISTTKGCLYRATFTISAHLHKRRLVSGICSHLAAAKAQEILKGRIVAGVARCPEVGQLCRIETKVTTGQGFSIHLPNLTFASHPEVSFSLRERSAGTVKYALVIDHTASTISASLAASDWLGSFEVAHGTTRIATGMATELGGLSVTLSGGFHGASTGTIDVASVKAGLAEVAFELQPYHGFSAQLTAHDASVHATSLSVLMADSGRGVSISDATVEGRHFGGDLRSEVLAINLVDSDLKLQLKNAFTGRDGTGCECTLSGRLNIERGRLSANGVADIRLRQGSALLLRGSMDTAHKLSVEVRDLELGIVPAQTVKLGDGLSFILGDNGRASGNQVVMNDASQIADGSVQVTATATTDTETLAVSTEIKDSEQPWIIRPHPRRLVVGDASTPLSLTLYYYPSSATLSTDLALDAIAGTEQLLTAAPEPTGTDLVHKQFGFAATAHLPALNIQRAPLVKSPDGQAATLDVPATMQVTLDIPWAEVGTDVFSTPSWDGHCRAHWYVTKQTMSTDVKLGLSFTVSLKTFKAKVGTSVTVLPQLVPNGDHLTGCPKWHPGMRLFLSTMRKYYVPGEIGKALKNSHLMPTIGD
jgi:hypothetical protein